MLNRKEDAPTLNTNTSESSKQSSPPPGTVEPERLRLEVADLKAILDPAAQPANSVRKPLFRS
jgi:hypothetical protein